MALGRGIAYLKAMKCPEPDEVALIYDGECPVCTIYSQAVDVDQEVAPGVQRVDARAGGELVARAVAAGLDLDEGMVVAYGGEFYHGADALHLMSTLAPRTGLRNRLNRLLFGSRSVARAIYPALRAGRNTLLRLLGRSKIGRLDRTGAPPLP
jgi:predicted DCC family thiol-disulfide oxidoreductase YuxK